MFSLSQTHTVDRFLVKCNCIWHTPLSLNLVNGEIYQIFIDKPGEDSVVSLEESSLELNVSVTHKAGAHNRYVVDDHKRSVNWGRLGIIKKYTWTSFPGKETEEIDNAHVTCLMYKLISCRRDSDDLSIDFHRSIGTRETDLTSKKTTKGNYHVRIYLKYVFGFAEDQHNCTYGLHYKLAVQRNSDNHVLSHLAGANDAANLASASTVNISDLWLYVTHYAPSISKQKLILELSISRTATAILYNKRSSYMNDVTTESKWNFELGVGNDLDVPIYITGVFMQRDQFI